MKADLLSRAALPAAVACLLLLAQAAHARPAYRRALADYLGPFLAGGVNACKTCHRADRPTEEDHAHNPFGARLVSARRELRKAGKRADLADRLDAVADEDSDGDGVPNLLELLAGTGPGDPKDRPADARLALARKALPAFLRSRRAYPWRPFETVRRPAVPRARNAAWVRNPIDAFIAAEHEERGLRPRPEAPRHVLLRRLYVDLTGLPPTPEEQATFLADPSPDAYEKVVDRLLASPQYGERWGRHWMDVWRYSDVDGTGNQVYSQPHIWRWRDWIVESLNADKGYDQMVCEMLAADELCPTDADRLRATGFLARNFNQFYPQVWLQDTVEYTAQALLGLTVRCARCHDHPYDPITQRDYYRLTAVFQPQQVRLDQVPGSPDAKVNGMVRVFDGNLKAQTFLFVRGDIQKPEKTPQPPGVPAALGGRFPAPEVVKLPRDAYSPDQRDFVVKQLVATSEEGVKQARSQHTRLLAASALALLPGRDVANIAGAVAVYRRRLEGVALVEADAALAEARHAALLAALRAERLEDAGKKDGGEWKEAATAAVIAQRRQAIHEGRKNLLVARQAHQAAAGKARAAAAARVKALEKALAKTEAAAKAPAGTAYTKRSVRSYPPVSTGRRLSFARWVVDRDNPLTARVAMNHVWLRRFGQPLVPRVFDLGRAGAPPTHAALLDWLAAELMEQGWSLKAMHRLMVLSSTYRMSSTPDAGNASRDPDNRYYWRMAPRRVEAEVVRDTLFHIAGNLDQTMGGPDIDHRLGLTSPRRSLYFRHAEDRQVELLKIFDGASAIECYQRAETIVPQQALALFNSDLSRAQARLVAAALVKQVGTGPDALIRGAFARVLCRPPTAEEVSVCREFLAGKRGSVESLVHGLMNHYEFRTVR
jgi:hypothetical protein